MFSWQTTVKCRNLFLNLTYQIS